MAQLEEKENSYDFNFTGYGSFHMVTFGKHKHKTVYQLANEGEWVYLNWLLRQIRESEKPNKKVSFKINSNMKPHVESALRTKVCPGIWTEEEKENNEGKLDQREIFFTTGEGLVSPTIQQKKCFKCEGYRNEDSLKVLGLIQVCYKCYKKLNST